MMKMMEGILDNNNNKVNIYWAHSFVKMISHIVHKMKTMTLEELVKVLEPLESRIEEENEGWCQQHGLIFSQFWVNEYKDSIQWLVKWNQHLYPLYDGVNGLRLTSSKSFKFHW